MARKLAKTERATKVARGTRVSVRAKSTAKPKADAHANAHAHANSLTKPLPKSLARPHGNLLVFSPELIADGKRRYETTPESLDSIAIDFSSNRSTLRNVAKREGWKRYVAPPRGLPRAADIAAKAETLEAEALEAMAHRTADVRSPVEEGNGAWSLRARIDALRGAVDDEIAAVRALRASLKGVPHSTETAGRTSRTLADLTTTLERLHRLEIGASQHNGQDAHANNHADKFSDIPADLDAFRDELARRIRAFVASRVGARNADGDSGPAGVDEVR